LIASLLPFSVDGMMVVATMALADGRHHRWSAWLAFWIGVTASVAANVLAAPPSTIARCISAWPAVAFLLVVEVITRGGHRPMDRTHGGPDGAIGTKSTSETVARPARRSSAQTRELAAELRAKFPALTQAELARQLGISATRLRQVERTKGAGERSESA
jgi:hypothetical protein